MLAPFSLAHCIDVSIENQQLQYLDANGMPSGWYADAWYDGEEDFLIETITEDGSICLHIVNPSENDARLCQDIEVEPNSYYRISCEIKTAGVSGGGGASVSVANTMAASEPVIGDADWQRVELMGITNSKQTEMTVCMGLGGYSSLSSGEAWFRGFSVEKLDAVPEGEVQQFYYTQQKTSSTGKLNGGGMLLAALLTGIAGALCFRKGITVKPAAEQRGLNVYLLLAAAFLLRCLLSVVFYGHSTDINCFMAWSYQLAENGPAGFYTSGMFADYPPGYMYILWLTGSLARAIGLEYGSAGYVLLTKLPSILADMLAGYMTYKIARRKLGGAQASLLCCLVIFNPAIAFISGGWGQVDMIPAVMLLGVIYLFDTDRLELAGLLYGAAIITKPQSLMVGPLLAVAYFAKVHDKGKKYALRTAAAVLLAVAAIFIISMPFKGTQKSNLWFVEKLIGTATSYPYASIEAFNMQALLGGNWKDASAPLLGLSYEAWGTIMIALSCVITSIGYIRSRDKRYSLALCSAALLSAIFTFGQYMHERYVFPVLPLLMAAFLMSGDRRLMRSYMVYSCGLLLNVIAAFIVVTDASLRGSEYNVIIVIGSIVNILAFTGVAAAFVGMAFKREVCPAYTDRRDEGTASEQLHGLEDSDCVTVRDRLFCVALTAIYAAFALTNLGTTQAPENYWTGSVGDTASITLEAPAEISRLMVFGGLYEGSAEFTFNGGESVEYTQKNDDMFRWATISDQPVYTDRIDILVTSGRVWINEIALLDGDGNVIKASASDGAEALVDEPEEVPALPSYLNGMYFDELYHGRTAYEHLHGIAPYENSHPPLGKVFIMLGIAVFGMNAFGWRIVGTLFGIAMVPVMFAFAKKLFKRRDYAFLAAAVFAFDFMHFTQSRIATIDVYGVFFIILMYYFMYSYYCMNFFDDGLKATLKPLALAGVFFGLGAASKWICIYAGGGLAVIFFTSLGQRYAEYRRYMAAAGRAERNRVQGFWRDALLTLLWCCVFYIAVPVTIYLLSYIPYVLSEARYDLADIWGVQEFMFSYHSGLTATHPYQSAWWQWPLDMRPVWYYISYDVPEGMTSTISAFGNPAVWWVCSACTGILCGRLISGKSKPDKAVFVLLTGLCANYLPWVLVTRCTFAYHFFASVPFIVLLTVWLIREAEERHPRLVMAKWYYLGLVVLLFVVFYPVISGVPVSIGYVKALEWLPGWTFMGY